MKVSKCTEDWNAMTTNEIGKFCTSCNTSVYQINNKSLEEISQLKAANNDKICGRINKVQYEQFRFLHPMKRFAIALFLVFGTGLFTASYGQVIEESAQVTEITFNYTLVIDAKDEQGNPLPGMNVSFDLNDEHYSDKTDSTGKLKINFEENSTNLKLGLNFYFQDTYGYIERNVNNGITRIEKITFNQGNGDLKIGDELFHEEFLMGDVMMEEDWDH